MAILLPAINARTEEEFLERAVLLKELGVRFVQLDVSDGVFGIPENFAVPEVTARELAGVAVDLHLMVRDVSAALARWLATRPARITVHIEVLADPSATLKEIRAGGSACGLALGPQTPLESAVAFLPHVEGVLFVAVPPGRSGQRFDRAVLPRIREARQQFPELPIGVDGGVTPELIPDLCAAGATTIVAASVIFDAPNPKKAYAELKRLVEAS